MHSIGEAVVPYCGCHTCKRHCFKRWFGNWSIEELTDCRKYSHKIETVAKSRARNELI